MVPEPSAPLIPPPTSPAAPSGTTSGREPFGWIALFLLFAFLIFAALSGASRRATIAETTDAEESRLRLAVTRSFTDPASGARDLEILARDLAKSADPRRTFLAAVVARELRRPVAAEALSRVARDPAVGERRAALVADDRPAAALLAPRGDDRFAERLALAQAAERSGTPRPEARRELADPSLLARAMLLYLGGLAAAALGIAAWIAYFMNRDAPSFAVKGEPSLPMTPAQADRFAWRGAGIFLLFLIGTQLADLVRRAAGAGAGESAQLAVYVAIAAYAWRMRAARGVPMIAASRLRGEGKVGRHVLVGTLAAFANVPLALVLGALLSPLLRGAPIPVHPSTQALIQGPALFAVLKTFVFAAICAPIWEETFFRGLLYQGLRGVGLAFWRAAALSSFLFSAIHPQGVAAWPPIFALAMVSCALVRRTGSLVPSFVMHGVWNAMALVGTLLIGPLAG